VLHPGQGQTFPSTAIPHEIVSDRRDRLLEAERGTVRPAAVCYLADREEVS